MRIDLAGWSSEGLRCPDIEIDLLQDGSVPSVALIQMPNGTGKTTTLQMLTAALDGEAQNWKPDFVRSFRRPGDARDQGKFIAKLLVDDRPLTFELTLDFEEGQARYRTTNPGSGGVSRGWRPPPTVHRFLTPQFIKLFVFDGEFADRLLDPQQSEAERAIDALCQLYLLEDIAVFADAEWERATKKAGATSTAGLTRAQNIQRAVLKRIATLESAKSDAESEIGGLEQRIAELRASIADHIGGLEGVKEDYDKAQAEANAAELAVAQSVGNLMQGLRIPLGLHAGITGALTALKENLDRLKLPENTSAQFFEELVAEPSCICGREMNPEAISEIRKRAEEYLGSEESGIINALKSDIEQFTAGEDVDSSRGQIIHLDKELKKDLRAFRSAKQKLRTLHQRLIDSGDEQIQTWETELNKKRDRFVELDSLIKRINAQGDDNEETDSTFSLKLLRKRLADVEREISKVTKTISLREQTNLVKEISRSATKIAREKIRSALLEDCNQTLNSVLSHDPVQLDRIEKCLHLAHQTGASVGQTLSVGYTFLMSVLKRGQNDFPLVVDSPAGPLDRARRTEIGNLIPSLCSQFVGFTISTERMGFISALEEAGTQIRYLTLFRKTSGTKELVSNLPKDGVTETDNAVLVEGEGYFTKFDVEEEAE